MHVMHVVSDVTGSLVLSSSCLSVVPWLGGMYGGQHWPSPFVAANSLHFSSACLGWRARRTAIGRNMRASLGRLGSSPSLTEWSELPSVDIKDRDSYL